MSRFEQVLGPAADGGGMTLNVDRLRQMLCEERVGDLPVVVLAAVGPRGSGKTSLLSAVQRSVASPRPQSAKVEPDPQQPLIQLDIEVEPQRSGLGTGAQSTGLGLGTPMTGGTQSPGHESGDWTCLEWNQSETNPPRPGPDRAASCAADRVGSAGAAIWPELLPVTLPNGGRAALLLLDTWGPFDDGCPPQQRAAVLLFSALVSSTLVVLSSAAGPVASLDDLDLVAKLGDAARGVRHCAALQELVLLLRDWRGAAPAGRQTGFTPLHGWAEADPRARRALQMMPEAADWYDEGAVLLFLVPDRTVVGEAATDPVALLAAPRPAKRFDEDAVPAGELADYLDALAAALATTPCDAASLLQALVEANQRIAARATEPVYESRMSQLTGQWQKGFMSEQELRGAHTKAAHDALLAFKMSRKMDSESMDDEKVKREFEDWLEEQYSSKQETMLNDAKGAEKDALEQAGVCKTTYEIWMQDTLKESPLMTMAELIKTHDRCRHEALTQFDQSQGSSRHSFTQQRMELSDELEGLFRKFATKLDQAKEEADLAQAEKSRITSAEKSAEQLYSAIMEAVQPDKLSIIHRRVQDCAKLHFDSKTSEFPEQLKAISRQRLEARTTEILQNLLGKTNQDTAPTAPRVGPSRSGYDAGGTRYGTGGTGYPAGGAKYHVGGTGYLASGSGYPAGGTGYPAGGAGYGGQTSYDTSSHSRGENSKGRFSGVRSFLGI